MKKPNYLVLILISIPLFISCSSKNIFIAPEYMDKKINDAVLILPTINEVQMQQQGQLFDENELKILKSTFLEIFKDSFKEALNQNSTFTKVIEAPYKVSPEFETRSFNIGEKENVSVILPRRPIEFVIEGSIYVLFFQDFTVAFENEQQDTSDPAKHFSVETQAGLDPALSPQKFYKKIFVIRSKYAIYDNNTGKDVLCSSVSVKENYQIEMNVDNLIRKAISKFAEKILSSTPFEK